LSTRQTFKQIIFTKETSTEAARKKLHKNMPQTQALTSTASVVDVMKSQMSCLSFSPAAVVVNNSNLNESVGIEQYPSADLQEAHDTNSVWLTDEYVLMQFHDGDRESK
jgi:hypothetical protein